MASRKHRPLLFEIARGRTRNLGDPRERPEESRAVRRPTPPERLEPQPAAMIDEPEQPTQSADSDREDSTLFSRRGIMIAIVTTAAVVLLFVGIQTRSYFQADTGPGAPDGSFVQALKAERAEPPVRLAADQQPAKKAPTRGPAGKTAAGKPAPQKKTLLPAVPAVELQRGYSYVVVQHFPKRKAADAQAAALYLRDKGIPCAIWNDKDIQLIAVEPFDTGNADASVRKRASQRAESLMRNIRELGKTYFKTGRYDFKGCKLRRVK